MLISQGVQRISFSKKKYQTLWREEEEEKEMEQAVGRHKRIARSSRRSSSIQAQLLAF